jgi:CubicO group peptidase (beta-lactamase class C family)
MIMLDVDNSFKLALERCFAPMKGALAGFVLSAAASVVSCSPGFPSSVAQVVETAIDTRVFPGAVVGFGTRDGGLLYSQAFGNMTYGFFDPPATPGENPPVDETTRFDLASLSKVTAATSAAALLYQHGYLELDEPVSSPRLLGPGYANNGKDTITMVNLLTHAAGTCADPPET